MNPLRIAIVCFFVLTIAAGGLALHNAPVASNGQHAPLAGAQYDYLCRNGETAERTLEWDILGVSNGVIQIGEKIGGEVFWREVPAALFGSTLSSRRLAVDGQRRMESAGAPLSESGAFTILGSLTLGGKAAAEVIEHMGQGGVVVWLYEFEVEKQGKTKHDLLGEPDVVIISEARSHGFYESRRKIFYAPDIRGPLGFNYADTFGNDERCILSAYRAPGEASPRLDPSIVGLGGE